MTQPHRGRPPRPLDPDASHAARLGAEIRTRRQVQGLTLKALADRIGFSPQHISEVERANVPMSEPFVAACDRALAAHGALLALLPAIVCERALERHDRSTARRRAAGEAHTKAPGEAHAGTLETARYARHEHPSDVGEDVDPLSRRSLLGAGAGAAFGLNATAAPAAARDVDPELVEHWLDLLTVLESHDASFGPHAVRDTVRHEIRLIAEHRRVARGVLRTELTRVEARWAEFASWLGRDAGDERIADYWAERAMGLAEESRYPDMAAYVLVLRSRWATNDLDAPRAVAFADAARDALGTSDHLRALCALQQARSHALAGDADRCDRSLADTRGLLERATGADRRDLAGQEISAPYVLAAEARCALSLRPRAAISMFEEVLRDWPQTRTRSRGIHQTHLALACAAADEPERAACEGMEALHIAAATRSDIAMRKLTHLDRRLIGCDAPAAQDFRAALAAS
jgi:transcriptional regulator with XRE-family HTH domain